MMEWKQVNRFTSDYTTLAASVGLLDITIDHYPADLRKTVAGYYVRVVGRFAHTKVKPFATLEEAKDAGYKLLRKEIRQMLKELDAAK